MGGIARSDLWRDGLIKVTDGYLIAFCQFAQHLAAWNGVLILHGRKCGGRYPEKSRNVFLRTITPQFSQSFSEILHDASPILRQKLPDIGSGRGPKVGSVHSKCIKTEALYEFVYSILH